MRVNALQVVYLMKIFEEKMLTRAYRSAIIVTSSMASFFSAPCNQTYNSTKALVSNFGEANAYEVDEKIDVIAWNPAGMRTKIFADGAKMS